MINATDTFTPDHLSKLKAEFARINTVDPRHLDKFRAMFDKLNDISLLQLCSAEINFVSKLAVNAAIRRGINPLQP